MMKLRLVCLLLLFSGCVHWEDRTADSAVRPQPVPSPQAPAKEVTSHHTFHNLEALVTFRHQACQLPVEERDQLLNAYREMTSDEAVLGSLMLATCEPDQTPGLLANSLVAARSIERPPPGFPAFLELLAAEAKSYALLERRLKNTQKKLDDMIDGIRAIEAEMGESTDEDALR
jgi:hypothetical protein